MGSFSFLSIDGYPIFSLKNHYNSYIKDILFHTKDIIHESRYNSDLNELYWGRDNIDRPGKFKFLGFEKSVRACKQRLELLGHSYKRSKKDFEAAKRMNRKEPLIELPFSSLSYSDYLDIAHEILRTRQINYEFYHDNVFDFLCGNNLMMPYQSEVEGIYSILSLVDPDSKVVYDLSDIYQAGHISIQQASQFSLEKVVILAEGKTDVEFLSSSLQMLYPELSPFFHFLDFDGYKVEGGGSALVRLVKGFAAANIKHPIIVLFDNDTAGIIEMKKLEAYNLPTNIKILKYPDITLAKKYPTIGPQGKKLININGKACSIEMYLGTELLQIDNEFIPIRWLDYNQTISAYHGVIEQKDRIQKEFRARIKDGKTWEMPEMQLLLEMIFKIFQR